MTLVSQERAILFADVSGSTALYERLGDKPAAKAIETLLEELRGVVTKHQGKVVKTIGDELMVVFDRPGPACEAAKEMQHRVTALPPAVGVKLAIRIGFHFGPVLEEGGDFWGDGVNTASRLAGLAKRGQILTSGATADTLLAAHRSNLRDLDVLPVKGKQDAVHVFELVWGDMEDATQVARVASGARVTMTRLSLRIRGHSVDFPQEKAELMLGRETSCDIVVGEMTASRRHARIERAGAQYVLVDESTNGTYVEIEGDREVLLHRDRIMLRGRGTIAFGTPTVEAAELLQFDCS